MFQFIRRRRPAVKGLIIGGMAGLAVALGYGLTGAWLCTGIRGCPASWEPFALVASIIFVAITVAGVVAAVISAKLYKIFDTALRTEGVVTTSYPAGGGGDTTLPERSEPDA